MTITATLTQKQTIQTAKGSTVSLQLQSADGHALFISGLDPAATAAFTVGTAYTISI